MAILQPTCSAGQPAKSVTVVQNFPLNFAFFLFGSSFLSASEHKNHSRSQMMRHFVSFCLLTETNTQSDRSHRRRVSSSHLGSPNRSNSNKRPQLLVASSWLQSSQRPRGEATTTATRKENKTSSRLIESKLDGQDHTRLFATQLAMKMSPNPTVVPGIFLAVSLKKKNKKSDRAFDFDVIHHFRFTS